MLEAAVRPFITQFDTPDPSKFVEISRMIRRTTPDYRKNKYYSLLGRKKKLVLAMVVRFPKLTPVWGKFVFR